MILMELYYSIILIIMILGLNHNRDQIQCKQNDLKQRFIIEFEIGSNWWLFLCNVIVCHNRIHQRQSAIALEILFSITRSRNILAFEFILLLLNEIWIPGEIRIGGLKQIIYSSLNRKKCYPISLEIIDKTNNKIAFIEEYKFWLVITVGIHSWIDCLFIGMKPKILNRFEVIVILFVFSVIRNYP